MTGLRPRSRPHRSPRTRVLALLGSMLFMMLAHSVNARDAMLLDDFTSTDGRARNGARWMAFTDRVMGGVSRMDARVEREGDLTYLRMTGDVRLENDGGFVQVALTVRADGEAFDASAYGGVGLRVRGNGERYSVHLRTSDIRAPWQYYWAEFEAPAQWTEIVLPWSAFAPASLATPLDPTRLRRVAVVAAKKRMQADIAIARVELAP